MSGHNYNEKHRCNGLRHTNVLTTFAYTLLAKYTTKFTYTQQLKKIDVSTSKHNSSPEMVLSYVGME